MQRFVIERAIPEIGSADREALKGAAGQSNGVLSAMQSEGKHIRSQHSDVTGDRTFCIYVAERCCVDRRVHRVQRVPGDRRRGSQHDHRSDDREGVVLRGAASP